MYKSNNNKKEYSAVALEYNSYKDLAPRITASGKGGMAEKIIQLAYEYNIPIYEDSELVEILSILEINSFIPIEVYGVVAEILSYIHNKNIKLK